MSHHTTRHASAKRMNYVQMSGFGDAEPPEDGGLTDCPVCDGDGFRFVLNASGAKEREVCPACEGARFLDEYGYPVKQQEEE